MRGRRPGECAGAAAIGNPWRRNATRAANSMRSFINLGIRLGWVLLAAVAILALAVRLGAQGPAPAAPNLIRGTAVGFPLNDHLVIRQYALDFDGDHSLDMATVIEHVSSGYATYTIQLHLASGADQSVVVAAPPGGLQIEMHDMTGDKVPNDLVLRPALLRWLPTILVNDGHDHFAVAIRGTDPGSFSSSGNLDSKRQDSQAFFLLSTIGFRVAHFLNGARCFYPQLQQAPLSSSTRAFARHPGRASSPGRAPPFSISI